MLLPASLFVIKSPVKSTEQGFLEIVFPLLHSSNYLTTDAQVSLATALLSYCQPA